MVEIVGEKVTRVWKHGCERYPNNPGVIEKHLGRWVLAALGHERGRGRVFDVDRPIPPVELIWRGDVVVGVRADV